MKFFPPQDVGGGGGKSFSQAGRGGEAQTSSGVVFKL